ncbi:cytochrome P450 [Mongoliimonas terrestris]|uniref:cytochrome P450 n=1 Tax=Mongoliimonas terrestris TaxID=1709001 RepID=UPI00094963AD|nr:cytochrome P450 [Mongoliimonas terrestris]
MTAAIAEPSFAHRPVPPAPVPGTRELGYAELLLRLRSNPLTIWRRIHFERPVVSGKSLLGHAVVLNDPAAIRHVFVDNVANYRKDDLQRSVLAPGLGEGLLTAEGDVWKRTRRTVAPLFTPKAVAALAPRMEGPALALAERMARRRPGRVLDITHDMTRVTYDILAATLFSETIAGGASAFSKALTRYFETQGRIDPLDVLGAPAFVPRLGRLMARPAIRFFEDEVIRIIKARRAELERADEAPADLLTALLRASDPETGVGLTEAEVGANIVTFIGAGHETTANVLTWSLYLLAENPDVLDAVEREADAVADDRVGAALSGTGLDLTRAVIEEAMRLYPPVASLSRAAIADDRVGDVAIPKGATVVVAPYVLHRHRLLWEAPERFMPERFLPPARAGIDRFAFLPFGAGPRICVGAQFALVEAMIVLTTLVHRLRFAYAGDGPPRPVQRITLRPADGMPMRVDRRR